MLAGGGRDEDGGPDLLDMVVGVASPSPLGP